MPENTSDIDAKVTAEMYDELVRAKEYSTKPTAPSQKWFWTYTFRVQLQKPLNGIPMLTKNLSEVARQLPEGEFDISPTQIFVGFRTITPLTSSEIDKLSRAVEGEFYSRHVKIDGVYLEGAGLADAEGNPITQDASSSEIVK